MFLKIFLCSSLIVAASPNNVIPAQTYPIYQQNGYMNPQANQPNNIQPYLQAGTAQNQLQQLNISPSTIKQALLNKLLTGQPLQTNVGSNAKIYSPNLNGVQNNHIPVNLANNYAVVPQDYLKNNTSYVNIDTKSNNGDIKKTKQSNKRRSKPRRQKNAENIESKANQNKSSKNQNTSINIKNAANNTKSLETQIENNKSPRKPSHKQNSQVFEQKQDTSDTATENREKRNRRRKKKEKEPTTTTTESPIKEETKVENPKPQKRRRKQKVIENTESETQVTTKPKGEAIENVDLDITGEGLTNEYRQTRNSKHDPSDLLKSIPYTPKEVTNPFLTNIPQFNNPLMGGWFGNFENIIQSFANQPTTNEVKPKRRRKSKRNKKHKKKIANNRNSTAEASVVSSSKLGIGTTTTERIVCINENSQTNLNPNPTNDNTKSFETRNLSSNEIFRDGYNIDELQDRYDTSFYGGYIDDYYPLFTDSAAYNANNKEIILKNLNDNKYYYTTDIVDTDVTSRHHRFPDMFMNYERNKHTYDEIERESIRNAYKKEFDDKVEEKLQFRSPPFLESPDFRTRQIDKSELKPEVYYVYDNNHNRPVEEKSSTYSNAKNPYNTGAKRNDINTQPKEVETVYAKSKVVSYGPVYTPEEDSSSAATSQIYWSDHDYNHDSFQSGDTTFVVAKSLDHPEPYM